MIRFFRHIRKTLMGQNKTRTYFFYAVGEVALVMIGILLALQVNTWSQENVTRQHEMDSLLEMKQNLEQDTLILFTNLQTLDEKVLMNEEILDHIENKRPYEDRFDRLQLQVYYHRGYDTFNTAAYELLRERGFDIIQNSELRKNITSHYTTDLSDIRGVLDRIDNINLLRAENMYEHFLVYAGGIRPFDYEQALQDPKVYSPFYHYLNMNQHYREVLNGFRQKTITLLKELNSELDNRSDS